jgi:hypothetical protein
MKREPLDADSGADDARRLANRAELAETFEISVPTLERLWAQRETNGHPPPADVVGGRPGPPRPRWRVATWRRWYEDYLAQRRGRTVRVGNRGDPGGPADFACVCGHSDTTPHDGASVAPGMDPQLTVPSRPYVPRVHPGGWFPRRPPASGLRRRRPYPHATVCTGCEDRYAETYSS